MFAGTYDQRGITELIEDTGLPKPNAYGVVVPDDRELYEMDGFFSSIGDAFKSVAKVAVPAVIGYSQGGYQGAGQAIGNAIANPKPSSLPSYVQQAPTQIPVPQPTYPPTYAATYPVGQRQIQQAPPSFINQNPWVLWAGGGILVLLVGYTIARR